MRTMVSGLCIPVAPLVRSTAVDDTRLGNDMRLRLGQMTEIRGTEIDVVGPKGCSYRRAGHNARVVLPDPPSPLTLYGRVRESRVLEGLLGAASERRCARPGRRAGHRQVFVDCRRRQRAG